MTKGVGFNRRTFLTMTAALAASRIAVASQTMRTTIKAIAFDGFAVFDARPVDAAAKRLFPDIGEALAASWRARQFEYTWLRTLTRTYVDFWQVTDDALTFAAKAANVALAPQQRDELKQAWLDIEAWPDVRPALEDLKRRDIRLAFLANPTSHMLDTWIRNSSLEGFFEPHLTTDRVQAFKPDPRAYQMAVDAFGVEREAILFAAFGGWDAAGAKAFGYPTYWVNRSGAPTEELGFVPDGIGGNLSDLGRLVAQWD
jgi:2-haloacid dehalogenase